MFKIQIFVILVGGLLVGLGLTISLGAAVSGMWGRQQVVSPLDQVDELIEPEEGFVPLFVPTIDPNIIELKDQVQSASQLVTAQAPATLGPALTKTPAPVQAPDRIVIPAIKLDAPVVPATLRTILYHEKVYPQWVAPDVFAAGWDTTSATPGIFNNTVLFGHHNAHGEVFRHLVNLEVGDLIVVYSGKNRFTYIIVLKMILPERNEPVDVRLQNARWILPSDDERLTLLTCWPYTSNTHRLIIVAIPIVVDDLMSYPITPRLAPQVP
jgi:LPXTG-site transpeptidase (sortase) family protein